LIKILYISEILIVNIKYTTGIYLTTALSGQGGILKNHFFQAEAA